MNLRREAVIKVSDQELASMLDLPDEMHIERIKDDFPYRGIALLVSGPTLDEVDDRIMPPVLLGRWERDGQRHRWYPPRVG